MGEEIWRRGSRRGEGSEGGGESPRDECSVDGGKRARR